MTVLWYNVEIMERRNCFIMKILNVFCRLVLCVFISGHCITLITYLFCQNSMKSFDMPLLFFVMHNKRYIMVLHSVHSVNTSNMYDQPPLRSFTYPYKMYNLS